MQKATKNTAGSTAGAQELVREQAKWEAVLEAEGLGVIGPETLEFDVSPDPELKRMDTTTAASVKIPTAGDRQVLDRIRQGGTRRPAQRSGPRWEPWPGWPTRGSSTSGPAPDTEGTGCWRWPGRPTAT